MRAADLEHRVVTICDRVIAKQPVEDSRVELKRDWPPIHYDAARRIAGHANAAHGDQILWVLGVDEQNAQVPGVDLAEFSNWWAQVKANFQSIAPSLMELAVPIGSVTVMALLMDTERAPFVVINPGFGSSGTKTPISAEVPWREGTSIRTARREDLIKILVPVVRVPSWEILSAGLRTDRDTHLMTLGLKLYLSPQRSDEQAFIPFHRCKFDVRFGQGCWLTLRNVTLEPEQRLEHRGNHAEYVDEAYALTATAHDVRIAAPGMAVLRGCIPLTELMGHLDKSPLEISATLPLTGADSPIAIAAVLEATTASGDEGHRWIPISHS